MPVPEGLVVVGADGLARVDPGGLVRTTNGIDNRCCCGRAGCVACFGATVCCGPSGCGRRPGDGPPVLRKIVVSGTGRVVFQDLRPPVFGAVYDFDFRPNGDPGGLGPVRVPRAWTTTRGVPDGSGNCRWRNGAHGSPEFVPLENFRYRYLNVMRWEIDLLEPLMPYYARLDFTQSVQDVVFEQDPRRSAFVKTTWHPGESVPNCWVGQAGVQRSPNLAYTVDELYRASACAYGVKASLRSVGRVGAPELPDVEFSWDLDMRMDACWSLCACTGADPGARAPGPDDPRARAAFEEQVSRRLCAGCGEGFAG